MKETNELSFLWRHVFLMGEMFLNQVVGGVNSLFGQTQNVLLQLKEDNFYYLFSLRKCFFNARQYKNKNN